MSGIIFLLFENFYKLGGYDLEIPSHKQLILYYILTIIRASRQ